MTTAKDPKVSSRLRLPDPPEREPDEKMTSVKHLHQPGTPTTWPSTSETRSPTWSPQNCTSP